VLFFSLFEVAFLFLKVIYLFEDAKAIGFSPYVGK
jgi:hypothetical protein